MALRWVQIAVVHGSIDSCDGSRFPSIFVRLDEPDILRWIYRVVFPDRLDEIECNDDYYYYEECLKTSIVDASTQGKHFDEIF